MNVWFVNHYAGLTTTVPATRTYDLGRQLVRLGHRVTIFACSFNHYTLTEERLKPGKLVKTEESEGVRFVWIRGTSYQGNDWRRLVNMLVFALLAFIVGLRLSPKPDIIIGTTVHPFAPISAFLVSRALRARVLLDITDIWPESLIDLGHLSSDGFVAKLCNALENFSLRRAEVVTSVLPNIADYLRDKGLSNKPTVWIPNGIDSDRLAKFVESDALDNSYFTVTYAGGFAPAHALDVILEAAADIQLKGFENIRFVLVGDGPEMGTVKTYIAEYGLKNVTLPGFIPKHILYSILSEADAFLVTAKNLPVYRYGISFNKISDYLLVGRPIVFAVNSSNNPVSEAGAGISVPGENPKALAEAIIQLSELSINMRQTMGKCAQAFALEHFDYAIIARRLAAQF